MKNKYLILTALIVSNASFAHSGNNQKQQEINNLIQLQQYYELLNKDDDDKEKRTVMVELQDHNGKAGNG